MKIIIQAGGKGTRLEGLTRNKPKCIVPVNNLPIIFYAFEKFEDAEFFIIADYKTDVLEKYLAAFAGKYKYKIIQATRKGTISGIKEALTYFDNNERVVISWCDLILSKDLKIPEKGNYIGISKDFECRWSFIDGKFKKIPSKEHGVAGFFMFENKALLEDIAEEGALVGWLANKNIEFLELSLSGTKEIGTMIAFDENNYQLRRWRPFNHMIFDGDFVIKDGINEQGKKIAIDERAWYRFVKSKGYEFIPEIYEYEPLKMRRVQGQNIYDYDWAKLYYSLVGNYDQFNRKKFTLDIKEDRVEMAIKSNAWEDMEEFFFDSIPACNKEKIKALHSMIWLSLTTYAWEDYDSICGAFYNGVVLAKEML